MKNRLLVIVCLSLWLGLTSVSALGKPQAATGCLLPTAGCPLSVGQDKKAEAVPEERKQRALALLKRAEELAQAESEPIPKAYALMMVANGYQTAQDTEKARALLAVVAKLLTGPEELGDGLSKDALMSIPIAAMRAQNGDAGGWETLEEMVVKANSAPSMSWQAQTLGALAGFFYEAGRRERGLELLAQAVQRALVEDDNFRKGLALERLATKYAILGQREKAIEVALLMDGKYDLNQVWENLAIAYAEAGEPERASELSRKIIGKAYSVRLAIAEAHLNAGATDKAVALLKPLLPQARPDVRHPRAINRIDFTSLLLRAGLKREGLKILREDKDDWRMRSELALELHESQPALAEQFAQEAYVLIQAKGKGEPYDITHEFREIAFTFIGLGQKEKVAEVLAQMRQAVLDNRSHKDEIDSSARDSTLDEIAMQYAMIGQDDDAIKTAEAIIATDARGRAFATVAAMMLTPPETFAARFREAAKRSRVRDELQ